MQTSYKNNSLVLIVRHLRGAGLIWYLTKQMASYILYECASGYALLEISDAEEIGSLLDDVQRSFLDFKKFSKVVNLKAFQPFKSAENALENMNAVSEQIVTEDLKNFLEMNLPKVKKFKKSKMTLGIIEPSLGSQIQETLEFPCRSDDVIKELVRGIRLHFTKFIKELDNGMAEKAQLGLGHSFSRSKVKLNPAKSDNMIIQSIAILDQLDKDLNTFMMRVTEWYSWHFPELREFVKDGYMYARCAAYIGDRHSFTEDKLPGLVKIVADEDLAQHIHKASKLSMGMDASPMDILNVVTFTERMVKLSECRRNLYAYLIDKMSLVAPNLSKLIGETVGARLISKAGSLVSLSKCPASTVQILGAEKALFRALKNQTNTPKYGLIYHSTFIGRAGARNKGRISRVLANKCSIASRIDSFSESTSSKYGEQLREQMEERLRFYESGVAPRRNVAVMKAVADSLRAEAAAMKVEEVAVTETSVKKKKRKLDLINDVNEEVKSAKVLKLKDKVKAEEGDKEGKEKKQKKNKKSKKIKKEAQSE